ncbi:MAG: hypothetical protein OHK0056_05720 [Bacteriovoracaceae bacterium]
MKKLYSAILIHFLWFNIAFGETIHLASRAPAQWEHDITIEDLKEKLESFKVKILGKELEAECKDESGQVIDDALRDRNNLPDNLSFTSDSEENMSRIRNNDKFMSLLKDLKKNACGHYVYTWDPETPEEKNQKCEPKKQKGLVDRLVEQTMQDEKDGKTPKNFSLEDPEVRKLHQEAEFYLQEIRKYLADRSVDEEIRKALLVSYLDTVALPMRDLIVAKRSYMENEYDGIHFYESLLPDFPTNLFPEDDVAGREQITLGPNPSVEPFHLEIEEFKWGRSRLRYRPVEILQRDLLTLLKAPTSMNYVRGLKWMTLHMMLSQMFIYRAMLDDRGSIKVPNSCQKHLSGGLPPEWKFKLNEDTGETYVDNLLANHGLIFSTNNYQFIEFYLDNAGKNPLKDGFSGMMPFENYKAAQIALTSDVKSKILAPQLDDYTHFERGYQIRLQKVNEVYKQQTSSLLGLRKSRGYTYLGSELMDKILAKPSEMQSFSYKNDKDEEISIAADRQNLSVYLAEYMQRNKIEFFEDVISRKIKADLQDNLVKIDFPSFYTASVWKQWAFNQLIEATAEAAADFDKSNNSYISSLNKTCQKFQNNSDSRIRSWCSNGKNEDRLKSILENLVVLYENGENLPLRKLTLNKFQEIYPFISDLWNNLRDFSSYLEEAKTNEYDYLIDQMKVGNPWARLRLSYLVALEEMSDYRAENMTQNRNYCFNRNTSVIVNKLKEAGRHLGLDRTLAPFHLDRLLDNDEKKFIWQEIVDSTEDGNSQLFSQEVNNKKTYDHLDELSFKTLISKQSVDEAVRSMPYRLSDKAQNVIDQNQENEVSKYGEFFSKMFDLRGQVEKQKKYFEDHAEEFGLESTYNSKMAFLMLDFQNKKPLFEELIRLAARKRLTKVQSELEEFCNLEPSDHEKFKTLFYSTTKAQNQLNQMAGLPSVPEAIMDKINSISPEEWTDMWLGIGSGLLGVAAIVIGGACTGVTGGLCAPLGVAMMAAGVSAMGMQISLVSREFNRKIKADENEAYVNKMEDLGFALRDSSDSVSRSWFWTVFEGMCIIPLVGVVSRSASVGTKLSVVTTKTFVQNTSRVGMKEAWRLAGQAGKTIVSEADVKFARYVLEFDSLAKSLGQIGDDAAVRMSQFTKTLLGRGVPVKAAQEATENVTKIRMLFTQGKISAQTMAKMLGSVMDGLKTFVRGNGDEAVEYVSRVAVRETPEVIDRQTAKVVSRYFGQNPKGMLKLMKSYTKRVDKAVKVMAKIEAKQGVISKVPVLGSVVNWARKLRVEHLAKYSTKFKEIESKLAQVAAKGGDLELFVKENMDDLTDLFINIPMRKRELPYIMLLQGGPHIGGPLMGRRMPIVSAMADGIIMRKFFNARSRMIYESYKNTARSILGLPEVVASETVAQSIRAFTQGLEDSSVALSGAEAQKLSTELARFKDLMTKKISNHVGARIKRQDVLAKLNHQLFKNKNQVFREASSLTDEALKRILFSPESIQEEAFSRVLWNSMNVDELFELTEIGDISYRVIKELSNYKDVDGFERFMNALRVLVIHRDPGVVEIM